MVRVHQQQLQRKVYERVEFLYDELGIEAMRCARRHHANTRAHASARLTATMAVMAMYVNPKLRKKISKGLYPAS